MLLRGLMIVLLAGGLECSSPTEPGGGGSVVSVRVGQEASFGGGDLRLRFASVAADSRCPVDVQCVWEGNAELVFEATARGGSRETVRLNTSASAGSPREAVVHGYRVRLEELEPQPKQGQAIPLSSYTAKVRAEKV